MRIEEEEGGGGEVERKGPIRRGRAEREREIICQIGRGREDEKEEIKRRRGGGG